MNDIPKSSTYFDFILYADNTSPKRFINAKDQSNVVSHTSANDCLSLNKLFLNIKNTIFFISYQAKKIEPYIPGLKIGNGKLELVQFNFLGGQSH